MGQAQGSCCAEPGNEAEGSRIRDEIAVLTTDEGERPVSVQRPPEWTEAQAARLQECIDAFFGKENEELLGLDYSFTVADPQMEGCPLIGCSAGFTKLVGYEMSDIVGRNCRFLVDPVPKEEINDTVRRHAREFCEAVRQGKDYFVPEEEREGWMPQGRPGDEILCFQRNARKNGTLLWNMFYMKTFHLGTQMDTLYPYIIALQSELPDGKATLGELAQNLGMLDQRMTTVTRTLAKLFFTDTAMRRDQEDFANDGFDGSDIGAEAGGAARAF